MTRQRLRGASAALGAVLACAVGAGQSPPPPSAAANCPQGCATVTALAAPKQMSTEQMVELRTRAWRLFSLVAMQGEGMPDSGSWVPALAALRPSAAAGAGTEAGPLAQPSSGAKTQQAEWQLKPPAEMPKLDEVSAPVLYESTFFNRVAYDFIRGNDLYKNVAPVLRAGNVRDIVFPSGSTTLKTFWYLVEPGKKVDVKLWDWRHIPPGVDALKQDTVCVAIDPGNSGCLKAVNAFYTAKVSNPREFECLQCPPLKEGQLLILVAMHIASKQMPEWLWSTFWWRGNDNPDTSGSSWTCTDAQRQETIGYLLPAMVPAWKNYSMDVTASFWRGKPRLDPGDRCGVPGVIGNNEQYLAAYNPFVEAQFTNGRKSSCIECHARADSDPSAVSQRTTVPAVDTVDQYLSLTNFEEHIRTDYVWTLWNRLKTSWPQRPWPPQPPQ
jgi:hypothetical protein